MKCDTIPDLEKFLAIQEKAMGTHSPEVASTMCKLADLYVKENKLDKAESLYRRSIEIRSCLSGFHRTGLEESEQRLQEVLDKKHGLKSSTDYPRVSSHAAQANAAQGNNSPAKVCSEPALSRSGSFAAAEKPIDHGGEERTAPRQGRSAKVINDAIHDTELEIELLRQMVGPDDPAVADLLTKLADLYCRVRMYAKMEPVLVDALKIRESACGSEHSSVSTELRNLASLYCVQERYALAEPLFKRAIAIRERAYGRLHPRVADVEEQYAQLLRRTNRVHQAEAIEKHINEIRSQHDSPSHPRNGTFFGVS